MGKGSGRKLVALPEFRDERRHRAIGYAHLTGESGLELAPVPVERSCLGMDDPGSR